MTYGELKKSVLALIDEYTTGIKNYTEDEDILGKLPVLINLANKEMAGFSKILATKIYQELPKENKKDKYTDYRLPSDLMQIKEVFLLDSNNKKKNSDYYTLGRDKIYINDNNEGKTVLEYYKNPLEINENTKDNFMLEIDSNAQQILPYKVANDILVTDPSANYLAFSQEYQRQLQILDTRKSIPTVKLVAYEPDEESEFGIL